MIDPYWFEGLARGGDIIEITYHKTAMLFLVIKKHPSPVLLTVPDWTVGLYLQSGLLYCLEFLVKSGSELRV